MKISYKRDGKDYSATVTLSEKMGTYDETASASIVGDALGAELETLDKKKAEEYEVRGGVVVKKIKEGGAMSRTRIQEGFIILSVNGQDISSVEALGRLLGAQGGTVQVEGIYPGYDGTYRYPLNLESQ